MVPPSTLTALPADFGKKVAGRADPYPTRSRCRRTPPRRNQNHHENHAHQQRRNQPADAHPEWRLTAGVGLLIGHGTWLNRDDFAGAFVHTGVSITDGITKMAQIDWPAAIAALDAGSLPCSAVLTELTTGG